MQSPTCNPPFPETSPGPSFPARIAALLLTLAPLVYVLTIVSTTGADTPSNDYIFSIGPIDQILSGEYHWPNFLRDSFIQGAHCMALPILARLAIIRLTGWNIYAELYLTVALFGLRLLVLHDLLTLRTGRRASLWLWPLLAALLFSIAQIDVFAYGDAGLQIGLVQLGLALGLWGPLRFPGTKRGLAAAVLGGVVASWSGGGGLLTWPVLLAGLLVGGYRRPGPYALLIGAGLLAALPYAAYFLSPIAERVGPRTEVLAPNLARLLAAIGHPLLPGMAGDQNPSRRTVALGCLGVGLLAIGVSLVWAGRRTRLPVAAAPAGLLVAWGLLNILATTMLRSALLSWYSTSFLCFWIGLVALAYVVWACRADLPPRVRVAGAIPLNPAAWSLSVAGLVVLLYVASNVTYTDKVMYCLASRAPAAAAAVRHYATAPTYAEELAFLGFGWKRPLYLARLARPLEKHRLGPFRAHQEWTLQGEFMLDHVSTRNNTKGLAPYWSPDRGATRGTWRDYRHLDLVVPPGSSVTWKLRLPPGLARAELRTNVAPPSSGGSARGEVRLVLPGEPIQNLRPPAAERGREQRLGFPLTRWSGQEITLRLASAGPGDVVFRYPVVVLNQETSAAVLPEPEVRPSNVDPPHLPQPGSYSFDLGGAGAWTGRTGMLGKAAPGGERRIEPGDFLQWMRTTSLPAADFDRLAVTIAADPLPGSTDLTAMRALLQLGSRDGLHTMSRATFILLPDGRFHTYTYPLRLLELDAGDRLRGIRLHTANGGALRLRDVRLIPATAP